MTHPKGKNSNQLRSQHNQDLIRRMRNGDSLCMIDSSASWYPPRPVIEKDVSDMARLYNESETNLRRAKFGKQHTELNVVPTDDPQVVSLEERRAAKSTVPGGYNEAS